MAPTHATKAGIRYRYYVSLPCLHGEAKTAKVGSVTRVPATDIEEIVVKALNEHLRGQDEMPAAVISGHAIARGRRWLDEIVSGSVTDAEQIALRERCSVRHVNMTISLAFLAPKLVHAAVEGRLPRGINIARLRDAPAEWSRQFEALGLNPQQ